jgi:hypothetical protein
MGRVSPVGPLALAAAEDDWSCRSLAVATAMEASTRPAEIAMIRKSKTIFRHPLLTMRTAEPAKSSGHASPSSPDASLAVAWR